MKIYIANVEQGLPTVEQARIRVDQALRTGRAGRYDAVKIIHGYGSSGKGGKIKQDVSLYLRQQKQRGKIKHFVRGDEFSPFEAEAREALAVLPELRKDSDYSRNNPGITIVVL